MSEVSSWGAATVALLADAIRFQDVRGLVARAAIGRLAAAVVSTSAAPHHDTRGVAGWHRLDWTIPGPLGEGLRYIWHGPLTVSVGGISRPSRC